MGYHLSQQEVTDEINRRIDAGDSTTAVAMYR